MIILRIFIGCLRGQRCFQCGSTREFRGSVDYGGRTGPCPSFFHDKKRKERQYLEATPRR